MGVRKTVFGSSLEKRCFRKLSETWGRDYHVYHNLPFLNVFTGRTDLIDAAFEPFTLSDSEYDLLKKTSIDFTVCGKKDAPLVCVEFDGLQDGFNIGTSYHLRSGLSGRKSRRAMIELKLRVAHGAQFPYLVLGSEEFRGLSDAVRLTIADGLIGEVIALRAAHERINAGFDPTNCGYSTEEFDVLTPAQQSEVIGDWVNMIEIECDMEHNPIVRAVARLSSELQATGYRITFQNDSQHDSNKWVLMQCSVTTSPYGSATARVRLPNYNTPFCDFTVHLAHEIGRLLALEQLRKQRQKHERTDKRAEKKYEIGA